jgi:prepilin-type N-terminal cleavage/methylation domain-containing protein
MRLSAIIRRLHHDRGGFTLVELLVAMAIMSIVTVILGSTLSSIQRAAIKQDALSQMNDQARLAVQQIDHEMRSGNVLYDPDLENGSGTGAIASCTGCLPAYTMRVYTQTHTASRGGYMCVLWTIDDQQRLLSRMWPPGVPADATGWRIVATDIVNRELGIPAFALDDDPQKGGRTLQIRLDVNVDLEDNPDQTTTIQSSYTGRNTSYGYPVSVCQDTPS